MTRDIASNDHNSTLVTPAQAGASTLRSRDRKRRRSVAGPVKTVSILGLVGAFVAAVALPAVAGSAAPAAPEVAIELPAESETPVAAQPQELVVASTVTDSDLQRNSLTATSAAEIEEAKRKEEEERQRQIYEEWLNAQMLAAQLEAESGSYDFSSPALASFNAVAAATGSSSIIWPLDSGSWYTENGESYYGWRWGRMHNGHDMTAAGGTPIYAVADGVVTRSSWWNTYGNIVTIEHSIGGNLVETRYAHQRDDCGLAVSVGEYVTAGQYIGCVGSTGWSYGNHLHFEVLVNGNFVNPLNWLYNFAG